MIIQINMPYSFVATSQEDSTRGLNQLKKQLTATIVRFNPQGGSSTDKVCLLEEDPRPGVYRVRTGLLPRIREMAPLCGLHIAGETDNRWRISKTFRPQVIHVPLRDYQERLVSGVLKHDMGVMCAATGAGKRLWVETLLPTPTGWKKIGDVRVGDALFDDQGKTCRVTQAHAIDFGNSFKIVFSDGEEIVADAEHLWQVTDRQSRAVASKHSARVSAASRNRCLPDDRPACHRVLDTASMRAGLRVGAACNYAIANTKALELPDRPLPLDPYVLGAWLGDGTSAQGTITVADIEIIREIERAGWKCRAVPASVRVSRQRDCKSVTYCMYGTHVVLRGMGLLHNKHVPQEYLRGSAQQRLSLLQGLLDTDGSVQSGQVDFAVTNEKIADAVYELAVSLGMKASRSQRPAMLYGVAHGISYRVRFTPTMSVFRLARKLTKLSFEVRQMSKRTQRYVVSIEPVPSVLMRCIAVDSPSHLYLAGKGMVPTHNTWMAAAIIARRNVPTIYLVHTLDLLEQTQTQLHDLLKVRIGIWGGGHKDIQPVTVGMVQTLVEGKGVDDKMFGQVIVDEVHHLAANTFYEVTEKFLAPIVVGLSATPYRQDKADLMIEAGGGPITARISVSELIDAGYLARPHILFHPVQTQTGYDKLPTWLVYRRYIVENEPRNQMIANLAKQGLDEQKTVLIYVRMIKHADRIVKHLGAVDYVVLDGRDDATQRRKVFGDLRSKKTRLVVSTLVREGVDLPSLDVIINAAGGSDTMQIVGRALRKSGDKMYATVHDFVDHAHITLLRSSHARIERLRQEPAFRIIAEV